MSYVELCAKTSYSFLEGASHPGEWIERAIELGYPSLGICDRGGVYGLPKALLAIQESKSQSKSKEKFRLISGAELILESLPPIQILAETRRGYGLMCRMLTAAFEGREKDNSALSTDQFIDFLALPGASEIFYLLDAGYSHAPIGASRSVRTVEDVYAQIPRSRAFIKRSRWFDGHDDRRFESAQSLAKRLGLPSVVTQQPLFHRADRKRLQDTLTCIRQGVTLENSGLKLLSNRQRVLAPREQIMALFRDEPEALKASLEIAEACQFSLKELRYFYPNEWLPAGETAETFLRKLVFKGARTFYPSGIPEKVATQIEHELHLIGELQFSDYFLTIWDIVDFARKKNILCQGRGSAANSVVCYCLGITAVDPVRMDLLFERFISVERGEPPDIDVDFEHERREEVIQYLYTKYGRDRAGMVAAVRTYRTRSAIREVTKVFGNELDASDRDKASPLALELAAEIKDMPRHLSIHSGGFVLSQSPLLETVPIEPARMSGRTIIQWDKYDLDALGLLKVDVLALGMLTAIHKTLILLGDKKLTDIPADDPKTYAMIQRGDTVGVFQIESRAQMNMLGRLQPRNFYDIVIEVAIVRPGPIVGRMVHPYLKRRRGLEPITYEHPKLKEILGRTLGVPLFQEQVMKMAIALAGFTAGEADRLRRAIGAWRSSGSIEEMGRKLMAGLLRAGLSKGFVERVFDQIKGFSEYGFPESHAASFALLAYASSYLKCHHPAEFLCALVNSQPLGFYANHTLVDDAKRHGVRVTPVDVQVSRWDCMMEEGAVRLGFRVVRGMREAHANALQSEREEGGLFRGLTDFLNRMYVRGLDLSVFERLAMGGALESLGMKPREALWEILAFASFKAAETPTAQVSQLSLFRTLEGPTEVPFLKSMDAFARLKADYQHMGLSLRGHPMQFLRQGRKLLRVPHAKLSQHGTKLTIGGLMIVRQQPGTAKGVWFGTLEDEEGFLDVVMKPKVFQRYGAVFLNHAFLLITGMIQRDANTVSLLIEKVEPFTVVQEDTAIRLPQRYPVRFRGAY